MSASLGEELVLEVLEGGDGSETAAKKKQRQAAPLLGRERSAKPDEVVLEEARDLEGLLNKQQFSPDEVTEIRRTGGELAVGMPSGYGYYGSNNSRNRILFSLLDFLEAESAQKAAVLCEQVKTMADNLELKLIKSETKREIEFILGCLGESPKYLQELIGAKKQTFDRWLGGGNAASATNAQLEGIVDALYTLRPFMSEKQMRAWFTTPTSHLEGGVSPESFIKNNTPYYAHKLREAAKKEISDE